MKHLLPAIHCAQTPKIPWCPYEVYGRAWEEGTDQTIARIRSYKACSMPQWIGLGGLRSIQSTLILHLPWASYQNRDKGDHNMKKT